VLRRVADHLFWASRYLERTQWRARLVDVNYHLILEVPPRDADPWEPLLGITAERDIFARRYASADEASVVNFFTFDHDNPASIANCIEAVRLNLSSIRHLISSEFWLAVNRLYLKMRDWSPRQLAAIGLSAFFADLRESFYAINGVIDTTMRRDAAYDFLEIGAMLERTDNIARLLDVKYHYLLPRIEDVGGGADLRQWAAVLRSASALEAFRQIYGNSVRVDRVVQMLIFDPMFPRSARYSADRLSAALERLASNGGPAEGPHTMAEGLTAMLTGGSAGSMIASGLHEFLVAMENQCAVISNSVMHEYMSLG
jgi:uncharacterized alpha-E superfamily protein